MPTEVAAGPQGAFTAALAGLLREELAGHGWESPRVSVSALGLRDELAVGVPKDAAAAGAPEDGTELPVQVYGHHALVGPLPRGGATGRARPCRLCLGRRWQSVRPRWLRDALELGSGTTAAGTPAYATAFAAAAVSALAAAHREGTSTDRGDTGGGDTGGGGADGGPVADVYMVDLRTLRVTRHQLLADPGCPVCGRSEPDDRRLAEIALRSAPEYAPGAFRVRGIGEYDLPTGALAGPVCGALGSATVHDLGSVSTSAVLGAFSMRSGEYLRETFWGGHADSYATSTRIGMLEGLERLAGMRSRARAPRVVASLESLGDEALDPRVCGLYSADFHRANPHVVPFSADREIPWVWGWSLRDRRPLLVPEIMAYYHTPGLENRFVQESSNGCASGGCLEEAVYFGLMEVVERDAFLLTWYGRAALPEIDAAGSTDPHTRQMTDRLAMYGYEARFFDARVTFRGIPVVVAAAIRPDGGPGTLCFGAGASLDPEAALRGGLCEIATDSVNLQGRFRRDEARLRSLAADFDLVRTLHDHPLVYGTPQMAAHASFLLGEPGEPRPRRQPMGETYAAVPRRSGDLREDLERCLAEVTDAGFDVVVVDQTLPEQRDLGLCTVKVFVPGLIPIDFGWERQRALLMPRMRTALREAGLRDRDLRPEDLNPAPHPFP
ncbi:TOMM precursor leader peptide-binding protein [Streptomyces sp. NPDC007264]|uniref:TOMM precursor leader peptide-binding protein n=1 Tax=Streptomyces sp. NPDC007264 TaxID=3364777 RepID=UPI0036DBB01E